MAINCYQKELVNGRTPVINTSVYAFGVLIGEIPSPRFIEQFFLSATDANP